MQSVNRTCVVTISHLQYSNSFQVSQREFDHVHMYTQGDEGLDQMKENNLS